MIQVKANRDFEQGGMLRFEENQVLEVVPFGSRYFLKVAKRTNKILIPVGYVRELTEEELK